jgi:hypothetical protein
VIDEQRSSLARAVVPARRDHVVFACGLWMATPVVHFDAEAISLDLSV